MDFEKLVEAVVKEVIKKLKQMENQSEKEKILVIASSNEEYEKLVDKIGKDYELHNYDNIKTILPSYQKVVMTGICNTLLSSLAMGLSRGSLDSQIIEFLMEGKKLYLIEEGIAYRKYEKEKNESLYNLYKNYEEKLESYGIRIVSYNSLSEVLASGNEIKEKNVTNSVNEKKKDILDIRSDVIEVLNKRLISESDLKRVYMNGVKEVKISKKAILTPLAQDFIRIHKMKVNRLVQEEHV